MYTAMPAHRYAVMQRIGDNAKQVGTVLAVNYGAAHSKALKLFSRHVWVERIV
jgi:hypothetical protein